MARSHPLGMVRNIGIMAHIDAGLSQPVTFSCFPKSQDYLINLRRRINAEIAAHLA